MSKNVSGRVKINGRYRPAYVAASNDILYVAPDIALPWREATAQEWQTFQVRKEEHQNTVGRIFDDSFYYV